VKKRAETLSHAFPTIVEKLKAESSYGNVNTTTNQLGGGGDSAPSKSNHFFNHMHMLVNNNTVYYINKQYISCYIYNILMYQHA
jgi:hypothetical protein